MNRLVRVWLVAALLLVGTAAPAAADPAGPTNYLSTIDSVEPPTPSIEVQMIGGDSFFEITQLEPVLIEVTGYEGEPYLRFRSDGVVEENRLSATTYLNEERYGAGDIVPDFVDNSADPQWEHVASEGRYAWHDHRSHWMNPQRPPGAEPGDTILEAVIPLVVDGTDVRITVSSTLQQPSSPIPWIAGTILGLLGVVVAGRTAIFGAVTAVAALVVGAIEFLSVPPETGPPITLWVPPALALVALALAAVADRRALNPLIELGLRLVAGVQLAVWALLGSSALWNSILPTRLAWPLHRFTVALAFVVGVGILAVAARRLWILLSAEPPPTVALS
ncbi:MAG: hypothetical protein ACN4GZ_12035 [Acidimicrobiales bacterium]